MKDETSYLDQFLSRNSVIEGQSLPLVHSTRSYNFRSIKENSVLQAGECDVFRGEKLNYFFVGRPSYRYSANDAEDAYWEFPACFVFEFEDIEGITRIFPFDSGAFNGKLYPSYIKNMSLESFMSNAGRSAAKKLVGAFFDNISNYFELKPKDEQKFLSEYSIDPMEMEIQALHRLAREKSGNKFDDRRFCIEIQSAENIDLKVTKPIAVICPSQFQSSKGFVDLVTDDWGAEIITYRTFSLNVNEIYGTIYEKVFEFYKRRGFL